MPGIGAGGLAMECWGRGGMADDAVAAAGLCLGAALAGVTGVGLWVTRTRPPADEPLALAMVPQHRRRTK